MVKAGVDFGYRSSLKKSGFDIYQRSKGHAEDALFNKSNLCLRTPRR